MNKQQTMEKEQKQIDSVPSKTHMEMVNSSVQMQNVEPVTRKRSNTADQLPSKEPATKKQRHNTSSVASSSVFGENSIEVLPIEMLETVLKNVTTSDLLNCRQVNRRWNAVSSQPMRKRTNDISFRLHFAFHNGKFVQKIQNPQCLKLLYGGQQDTIYGTKNLTDLVICLERSKNFPFTNFQFDNLSQFRLGDMKNFISIWGKNIQTLKVSLNDPVNDIAILKELIFESVPNLKQLEIEFCRRDDNSRDDNSLSLAKRFADSDKPKLPKLEVLCVSSGYRKFRNTIADILNAASNLKNFVGSLERNGITVEDFVMLESLGKLHCLKNVKIEVSEDLFDYWKRFPMCMDLELQSLDVSVSICRLIFWIQRLKLDAPEMINQLLRSSKDVIKTLSVRHPAVLTGLALPRLDNLLTLSLYFDNKTTHLCDLAKTFPNIKSLGIYTGGEDFIFMDKPHEVMPSVEVLRIWYSNDVVNEQLMKMFPNVKTLTIEKPERYWYLDLKDIINLPVIIKYWPNLENLGWQIKAEGRDEVMYKLDAIITGLPESFCEELSEKFRHRDHLPAAEAFAYQSERRESSILDLKKLKKFDVSFEFFEDADICRPFTSNSKCDCGSESDQSEKDNDSECEYFHCAIMNDQSEKDDVAGFEPKSIFYKTGFTKVSKFIAFDQMPNLMVRTQKPFG